MSVTVEMIAVAAGRPVPLLTSPTFRQWEMWVGDAMLLIRQETLRRGVEFASLNPETVDYVVREAVKAVVLRPDDATQVEVAIDDGRVSRRYQSGTGRIAILDDWWALLLPGRSGGFSVRPYHEPDLLGWLAGW